MSTLKADIARHGRGGLHSLLAAFSKISFHVVLSYRISNSIRGKGALKPIRTIVNNYARILSGCYISEGASIEGGIHLPHPTGIVIGEKVKIGQRATIYQNVTLGSSDRGASAYPIIGDDVTIFSNAVIVGKINVGDRAKIGAGAIVLQDVPADCVAVGNPAKILGPRTETGSQI